MREQLPQRRKSENFTFSLEGISYHVTFSRYGDGRVAEVFVTASKPGSPLHATLRDLGLILSVALQSGVTLEDLGTTMTRLDDGSSAGPLGYIVDQLRRWT